MIAFDTQYDFSSTRSALTIPLVALLLFFFIAQHLVRKRYRKVLPPGPPGLPVLGNVYDIPRTTPWVTYRDLTAKYGASPTPT